jgi:hypothetical protein
MTPLITALVLGALLACSLFGVALLLERLDGSGAPIINDDDVTF